MDYISARGCGIWTLVWSIATSVWGVMWGIGLIALIAGVVSLKTIAARFSYEAPL